MAENGILVPAVVEVNTPRWFVGQAPGETGQTGEPVEVGATECAPFACYVNVRVVMEGSVGAPDNENKSYAPGVGVVITSR